MGIVCEGVEHSDRGLGSVAVAVAVAAAAVAAADAVRVGETSGSGLR